MAESHAFISADTISLDSRAARKYRWCLYIYVLSMNFRVPGPLTACTTDIVLMFEGGCKYSRCKRRPVTRSIACNQPTYLSTWNHVRFLISHFRLLYYIPTTHERIIFHTNKPSLLTQNPSWRMRKPCLYRDAPNTTSCNLSHQSIRMIHYEQTENLIYPSVKIKRHIHNKLLAPYNGITDLSHTRFG